MPFRRYFFVFAFFVLLTKTQAQSNLVRDSLNSLLQAASSNENRAALLVEISKTYRSTVPDSAYYFADSALKILEQLNKPELFNTALLGKGVALLRQKKYEQAIRCIDDAKKYFISTKNKFYEAECKKFLGNLYNEQGDYQKGDAMLTQALNDFVLLKKSNNKTTHAEIDKSINAALHFRYLAKFMQSDYRGALVVLHDAEKFVTTHGVKNAAIYNSFGGVYANLGNHDSSLHFFLKGLDVAIKYADTEEELRYYNNIGYEYVKLSNYNKALAYYTTGIKKATLLKQHRTLGILLENAGSVYEKKAQYPIALEYYMKALNILNQYGQPVEVASAYTLIGEYYLNQKNTDEALLNFDSAQVILEKIKHKKRLAELYEKKGSVYTLQKKLTDATAMYRQSLRMRTQLGNADDLAAIHYTIAEFFLENYSEQNQAWTDSAIVYYKKAIENNAATKNRLVLANSYTGLGKASLKENKWNDAIVWFDAAVKIADSLKLRKNLYENYLWLSVAYEKTNNVAQSYHFYKLYAAEKDSVYNETTSKQIAEIETKYETEKKEKQIELLNKDNEIKSLAIKKQQVLRNSIIGGAVLLLIILILVFNRYRITQQHKQQAERMRISTDLHDEVGSTLSSIGMISHYASSKIKEKNNAEAQKMVDEIAESAMQMGDDINDIIWAINPRNDSLESVINRLRNYASGITQAKNITLHFNYQEDLMQENISMQKRKNIYLICKEAINNAVKYSECNNLWVSFQKNKSALCISVKDDGKGFNTENGFDSNGLKNMRQRAEDLGAAFLLQSAPGSGTTINVEMKMG